MLVHEFLSNTEKEFPDKTAIICGEDRISYKELNDRSDRLCSFLRESGFKKQDRAIIYLPNSIDSVVSLFGILKAGGIFVIINPDVKEKKMEDIIEDCSPKAIITDFERYKGILQGLKGHTIEKLVLVDGEQNEPKDEGMSSIHYMVRILNTGVTSGNERIIDIDLAALIYTSGSTGRPKGVMLTHRNIDSSTDSIIRYLKNSQDDIILNALPLSFDYGLYQILMSVKFGGTVVLEKSFIYTYQVLKLIERFGITGFPIVPTMATLIMRMKERPDLDLSSLRYITNTAQGLPLHLIEFLRQFFPTADIFLMYGLTECKRVSYLDPELIGVKPGSVGRPMPNVEVFLVDENDQIISEPGKPGQLVVRGSNVMMGYWNRPEENRKLLRKGIHPWERLLYTGDILKFDLDGDLYFLERMDNIIKVAGEKVSPREVEDAIYRIDGVREAVVIGVDDEILGKALKAVVSVDNKLSPATIKNKCKMLLERYMVPKYVEIWDELPKNDHGKIDRQTVVETSSSDH